MSDNKKRLARSIANMLAQQRRFAAVRAAKARAAKASAREPNIQERARMAREI